MNKNDILAEMVRLGAEYDIDLEQYQTWEITDENLAMFWPSHEDLLRTCFYGELDSVTADTVFRVYGGGNIETLRMYQWHNELESHEAEIVEAFRKIADEEAYFGDLIAQYDALQEVG